MAHVQTDRVTAANIRLGKACHMAKPTAYGEKSRM